VWPLRLTAVVVRDGRDWRIAQMSFSFPTTYFTDERIVEPPELRHEEMAR